MGHNCSHHPPSDDFRQMGKRLSNWGRWGEDDRIGTLNFITPETLIAAGRLIRQGKIIDLGMDVNVNGIQLGGLRSNPIHLMSITSLDFRGRDDGMVVADDYIFMPLQSVTQWDGLGHVGYDGRLYNNVPADTVSTAAGSTVLSIDQIAEKGIAGRGVFLDIAALKGVDMMQAGERITIEDLEAAEARQGVQAGSGDILIIRTGWIRQFTVHNAKEKYWNGSPGLDVSCVDWLKEREIGGIASDNWAVEWVPADDPDITLPFHCIAIRDMGMTLGEIFDLEALSKDCSADNVWEFFFTAPPLKVTGGVGAAITPLAIK